MLSRDEALALVNFTELFNKIIAANAHLRESKPQDDAFLSFLFAQNSRLFIFKGAAAEFFLFDGDGERIALCDEAELESLALNLGAAVHAHEIATVVLKAEKSLILEAIGTKAYRFVMDYARFSLQAVKNNPLELHQPPEELTLLFKAEGRVMLRALAYGFAHEEIKAYFLARLGTDRGSLEAVPSFAKIKSLCREVLIREDPKWMLYLS